jgi:hypothetical protein
MSNSWSPAAWHDVWLKEITSQATLLFIFTALPALKLSFFWTRLIRSRLKLAPLQLSQHLLSDKT